MVPARRLNPLPSWYASGFRFPAPEGAPPTHARPSAHLSISPCPSLTPLPRDWRRGPTPGRRETRRSTFPLGS